MENIIVGAIVAAALGFSVFRLVRIFRGEAACGCGQGCGCCRDGDDCGKKISGVHRRA